MRISLTFKSLAICLALAVVPGADGATRPHKPEARKSATRKVETATSSFAKLGQGVDQLTFSDSAGKPVGWGTLKGKPRVLFFGFTHCPVVCPVTVWELDAALAEIGPAAADLKINFVTLDPKRDTAPELGKYFSGFNGRVYALTGAEADIAKLAKAYEIKFQKVDTGKGDYTLDHTAIAFLIRADGTVADTLAFGSSRELSVTRLRALLGLPAGK